jgi:hypothetical protein
MDAQHEDSRAESGIEGRLVELEHGLEGRLIEKMCDMQTELLRGFAAFSEGQTIRQSGSGSVEP